VSPIASADIGGRSPRRAVFLDRDGVLVRAYVEGGVPRPPRSPAEFEVLPGVAEALARLRRAGLEPVVVTNQPDVARGRTERSLVEAFHARLGAELGLVHVYTCYHDDGDGCGCRKPKPGLLQEAAAALGLSLGGSFMVGDRRGDVEAGRRAGCTTLLIRRPYSGEARADAEAPDLPAAADWILRRLAEGDAMDFIARYLDEVRVVAARIDRAAVEAVVALLAGLRDRGGRLFILGVGGSAGNASHAVNDFRKICGIEAYTPVDNVSELTARINDDGWDTSFANWLKGSRLGANDAVCVFSVGGGDAERGVSVNLVRALEHARRVGARVCGVVGRAGGYTATVADACVVIPTVNPATVTPHTEAFQAVVWHLLVSHPRLQAAPMKWESLDR
jgi:D-sedoheptulose 7-phosphate isomerase